MRGLMYFKALARFPASPLTMHRLRGLLSSVAQRPPLCMARTNFAAAAAAAAAVAAAAATSSTVNEPRERLSFSLDGKVALVTGASRGIGFAIACGLAEQGATVVLGGTNAATLAAARHALLEATSRPPACCSFVAFDVANEQECTNAVSLVTHTHGHSPDILVNCAGINRRAPLQEFSTEDFHLVLRTNLTGPFVLARVCSEGMRERKWGRIVNVGSIMGEIGRQGLHAYVSAKHAVHGLTKSLAAELACDGITVNTVAPGYIRTDLTQNLQGDATFAKQICERTPAGRWGMPHEMAGPVVFLCSSAASYVNGACLVADGGMIETFHYGSGAFGPLAHEQ